MPSPRPQFRLSTLLWITLAVACWFGGMRFGRWHIEQELMNFEGWQDYEVNPYTREQR
ncbi:MAG TPA: hypothetical protein VND64_23745 [Pirellulales bacterium]|nr:hypothetical protein [Pirellulales bacterium]